MTASTQPRAGVREWLGLGVLLLPTVLLFLAMTVLFLATPQIAADLDPSSTELLWINDIYGLVAAALLVAMGTAGDRFGRRKVLMIGAAAFGLASIAAALAESATVLIAARAVMGIGAAAVAPSTLSLISTMFHDTRQRASAIGLWAASISVGVAVGPLAGGLLLESFWWGSALLIGVPVMALVLIAAPLLLPEYRAPGTHRLDLPSVLLSIAALLLFVYGLKDFAKDGVTALAVSATVAGLLLGAGFVHRQLRLETPLLDVRLFANRAFSGGLALFLLSAVALGGFYLMFTQYLQLVAGMSAMESGLWILPGALALVAVSILSPKLAQRIRPGYVIAAGALLSTAGYLVSTQVEAPGTALVIIGFYLLYPGIAPTMALATGLVIGAAPPEKAGAASAINTTVSELGTALGIALLGSIGTAAYRAEMPDGAPGTSGDNLPGALTAAEGLPAEAGRTLVEQGRAAFADGLGTVSVVAAVLVAGAAVLALTLLRGKPAAGAEADSPEAAREPARELKKAA